MGTAVVVRIQELTEKPVVLWSTLDVALPSGERVSGDVVFPVPGGAPPLRDEVGAVLLVLGSLYDAASPLEESLLAGDVVSLVSEDAPALGNGVAADTELTPLLGKSPPLGCGGTDSPNLTSGAAVEVAVLPVPATVELAVGGAVLLMPRAPPVLVGWGETAALTDRSARRAVLTVPCLHTSTFALVHRLQFHARILCDGIAAVGDVLCLA